MDALRSTILAAAIVAAPAPALADSCWTHNGSLMRLEAEGPARLFSYEKPKAGLAAAGIRKHTLLFDGEKSGNRYSGTARVFSKSCPGSPLEYHVEGPVNSSQTRVELTGEREVYENCQPTGRRTVDTLVFRYSHQC